MMSRGPAKKEIVLASEEGECNCFGYSQQSQQYFLSKHKSLQVKNKPSHHQISQLDDVPQSFKSIGKKSLRKNISPTRGAPLTSRSNDNLQDYYANYQVEPMQSKKEIRPQRQDEPRYLNASKREGYGCIEEKRITDPCAIRNNNHKTSGWPPFQANQYIYNPNPPALSPQRFIITHNNQPPPIRINFSHSPPPQKYSPQVSPQERAKYDREADAKKPALSEFKEQVKVHFTLKQSPEKANHEEVVDFELTDENIETPRNIATEPKGYSQFLQADGPKNQKTYNQLQSASDYFNFGETFRSRIEKPKSKNKRQMTYKSRIETNKSRIETKNSILEDIGKSKVRSLRDEKKSLKKIDDVEEIRSMPDSDEIEEDKESVVLGRLHEYGSMLDPTLSLTTPSMTSKLLSMNTQCSAIGKSFLKPFQFNMERTHFK